MVHLFGGEFKAGADVFQFQKRIVLQNLLLAHTFGEQVQHVFHAQPVVADARTAAALFRIKSDAPGVFNPNAEVGSAIGARLSRAAARWKDESAGNF